MGREEKSSNGRFVPRDTRDHAKQIWNSGVIPSFFIRSRLNALRERAARVERRINASLNFGFYSHECGVTMFHLCKADVRKKEISISREERFSPFPHRVETYERIDVRSRSSMLVRRRDKLVAARLINYTCTIFYHELFMRCHTRKYTRLLLSPRAIFACPNDTFGADRPGFVAFACNPFRPVQPVQPVQESGLNGVPKVSLALDWCRNRISMNECEMTRIFEGQLVSRSSPAKIGERLSMPWPVRVWREISEFNNSGR